MFKAEPYELRAIARLWNSADGQTLYNILGNALISEREKSDRLTDELQVRWNQGKRQALAEVIKFIKDAETVLCKMEENEKKRVPQR